MKNIRQKGLLLVLSTAIISGLAIFVNKYSVAVINPYLFAWLKNILVALLLCLLLLTYRNFKDFKKLKLKDWGLLVIIGLIGGSIPFLLFFKGLSLTSAAQGSFIHKTMFIYVAVLATIFLKEKLSRWFLAGAGLLLLGNLLFLKTIAFSINFGDLLVLLATIFWAIENTVSKHVLKNIHPNIVAWSRMLFGSLFILLFLAISGQIGQLAQLNVKQIGWVMITSALLFGYVTTWYRGLKYIPVSLATSVLLFGSTITTSLTLLSGGGISFKEISATTIIAVGVIIIICFDYLKRRHHKEEIYVRT